MKKIVISLIFMLSTMYGNANQANPQSDQQQKNLPNNFIQSLNKNVLQPIKKHPIKTFAGISYIYVGVMSQRKRYDNNSFFNTVAESVMWFLADRKCNKQDIKSVIDANIPNTNGLNALIIGAGICFLYDVFTSKNVIEQNKTSSVLQGKA